MNHKLLTICALAALTIGLGGCDGGSDDKGLDCSDGAYRAQCVDDKHMMYCDTATMTEMAKVCDDGFVCTDVNGVAECVDLNGKPEPQPVCTNGAVQCNGNFVQTCQDNAWVDAASACEYGCENGACKEAPVVVPDCTEEGAKQCNSDNSNTQTCTDGSWVDDDPACDYGCEDGACKEAPADACDAEGAKQCNSDNSNTQTCTDGHWVDDDPACELGCENGSCIEAPVVPDCEVEGAVQCNSDNSNVQTCTDGVWVDNDPACNYGCEGGSCKEPPVERECETDGAVQCAENTVQTCIEGKWTNADSACEFGCQDGACKKECETDGAVQCAGDTIQTCTDGRWVNADAACPLGCQDGACKVGCGDGTIGEGEECEGENLNGKTCADVKPMSTGTLACDPATCKFVADACELPAEGSKCDPETFIESCDGSKVIWCDDGKVVNGSYDCSKYEGRSCVVLDADGSAFADCMLESDRCEKVGDTYKGCASASGYDYSGQFLCVAGSDGNNYGLNVTTNETAIWCGEDDQADAPHCLAATGECGKLTDDEGSACDATFTARCDAGEIAVSCDSDDNVVVAEQCDDGLKCVLNDGVPSCLKPCTTAGESKLVCEYEIYWIFEFYYSTPQVCTDINGSLYYVSDYDNSVSCDHGCDTPDATCLMLSAEEGKECDPETYVPKCDGTDIALTCDDYYEPAAVYAESCSSYNEDGAEYVCSEGACVELCTTVGEEYFDCDDSYVDWGIPPESRRFVCTKAGDINVWIEDTDASQECESNQCAADGQCRPIVACDEDTFVPRCDGQETITCVDGMEYAEYNCGDYSGYSCKVITIDGDKVPYCFSSADVCTGTDEVLSCVTSSGNQYSTINGCFDADDGKKYLYMIDYSACDHGCDSATGECTKLIPDEGGACSSSGDDAYVEHCVGDVVAYCSYGEVTALDCSSSAGYKCATTDIDGAPYSDCVATANECTTAGETAPFCQLYSSSYGYGYGTKTCYAFDDGKNYYLSEWEALCDHGCNAEGTACEKLIPDEGAECSSSGDDAYVEHCVGDVVAYCSGGEVTALDCSSSSGYKCATGDMDGTPYTDCVTAANECTTVGEAVPFCKLYSSSYGYGYGTKTCVAFDDGKNYYVTHWENLCAGSCNADGTACAE